MGIGRASGENRAIMAAQMAIASPLLEVNINGAQGILFNISGSSNLSLYEVTEAAEEIRASADPEANIIFGTSFNERLGDEVMITVIATGFDTNRRRESSRRESAAHGHDARDVRPSIRSEQPRERDFLQELERQRQSTDSPREDRFDRQSGDERAAATSVRVERSVGVPTSAPRRTYDAEDLEIPSFLRRK
jgi:cell division protein FtsZ